MKTIAVLFLCLAAAALSFAAPATPVAVSTIAVAGSTVTVNSTAHGIIANQGFCLSAPASFCGTVVTAAANSFTFTSAAVAVCASSCGTVVPAKQIVALAISMPPNQSAQFVCWLATTSAGAGRSGNSAWSGASAAENTAIANGTTIEIPQSYAVPPGTALADFKLFAQRSCANLQSQLNSGVPPAFLLGNYFDGVGWLQ